MRIRSVFPIGAAIVVTVGGCDLLTDPGTRMIGIIGVVQEGAAHSGSDSLMSAGESECPRRPCSPDEPPIDAPDTVRANEAFQVVVWTSGQGGCERADGADVSSGDMFMDIIPYDRVVSSNCLDAPRPLSRDVALIFPEPGDAVIRVTGRVLVVGDGTQSEAMGSYDHTVVVLP